MIEKKILKFMTIFLPILMVATLGFLYSYPSISASLLKTQDLKEDTVAGTEETSDLALEDPDEVVEATGASDGRLKMELPEGITEADLTVENDYLTQTITVSFPTESTDYFSEYHMQGSCNGIASLSYYNQSGTGHVILALSQLCELEESLEDGNLYLKLIDPHDIYDRVIVVDAGHGGYASGATRENDSITEKEINLNIVLKLKALLDESNLNIGVYYTRLDDSNPTLMQRAALANAAHADLFISIHNNATDRTAYNSVNGTRVLYSESDTSELSSKDFATICLNDVTAALGSTNLGLAKADAIYIIRTSEVPVALIEVGFMTNREELTNLLTDSYQEQAAQGIYQAICDAFEAGF